jgi:hypothetical protein
MRQPRPTIAHEHDSRQVLFRFLFRLLLLIAFATFGTRGFGTAFSALLAMSAIFCAVAGAMRREEMLGPVLTHWDEAAAYAVLGTWPPCWSEFERRSLCRTYEISPASLSNSYAPMSTLAARVDDSGG